MKRRKYIPPDEKLIRKSIGGDMAALYDMKSHYEMLMRYKLNKEIMKMSEETGFEAELFGFDDLLCDMGVIFDNAVMNFKE